MDTFFLEISVQNFREKNPREIYEETNKEMSQISERISGEISVGRGEIPKKIPDTKLKIS